MSEGEKLTELAALHDAELARVADAVGDAQELAVIHERDLSDAAKSKAISEELLILHERELADMRTALPAIQKQLEADLKKRVEELTAQYAELAKSELAMRHEGAVTSGENLLRNLLSSGVERMRQELAARAEEAFARLVMSHEAKISSIRPELAALVESITRDFAKNQPDLLAEVRKELAAQPSVGLSLVRANKGNWNQNVVYGPGDIIFFRGSSYLVLRETVRGEFPNIKNQKPPNPMYQILAAAGAPGPRGSGTDGGGVGTVTSVDMTVPSFLSVTGNPITTLGTLAVTLATQTANTVFAGPTNGADATPTFRALVASDIPALPYQPAGSYVTSATGTADQVFVNGTTGSAQTGAITLTLPQSIATTSAVRFDRLGLSSSTATTNVTLSAQGTRTASSGFAVTFNGADTLTAAANSNSLYGLSSTPTIAKGAFTGLTAYGLQTQLTSSSGAGAISNAYGLRIDGVTVGTANWSIWTASNSGIASFGDTTDATSSTDGSFRVAGGMGIAKKLFVGTSVSAPQLISTVATGTAPFTVASTTNVANLNASSLNGATFAAPGSIGSGTPGSGAFTEITATSSSAPVLGITFNSSGSAIFLDTYSQSTGTATNGNFAFRAARNTVGSPSASQSGDRLGWFNFRGYGATGFAGSARAAVSSFSGQNWTDSVQGTYLTFEVTANGGTTMAAVVTANAGATGMRFNQYGAGTLVTDGSGNISATSDERAKDNLTVFTKGLDVIRAGRPKSWNWKESTGLTMDDFNVGMTAQELINAGLPEAVATTRSVEEEEDAIIEGKPGKRPKLDAKGKALRKRIPSDYMTVSDRAVIACMWNAIRELAEQLDSVKKAE